jgi:hypothetical protein
MANNGPHERPPMKAAFKFVLLPLILLIGSYYAYFKYEQMRFYRQGVISRETSFFCTEPWRNFRILKQASIPYDGNSTPEGFTIVYFEQINGEKSKRYLALYRGPKTKFDTCMEKYENFYPNKVEIPDGAHPIGMSVQSGNAYGQFVDDKKKAPPLDKIRFIPTSREPEPGVDTWSNEPKGRELEKPGQK